ncbi:MAG: hypothetical protein JW765_12700 [Deltaproteobacteria bacterium]|nr:hypothetical protein [Candidatus Zymogenaceae bacterium]
MDKKGFLKRFVGPVLLVFIVMALSWAAYILSPGISNFLLFQIAAILSGVALFISLSFGALYVYSVSYLRGAGPVERVIAALVNPIIWMTKEVAVVGSIYTVPEALFYYLNPVHLLLIGAVVAEMGAAELLIRRRLKRDGTVKRVLVPGAVSAVVIGLGWIAFMFIWDLGVHHFYIFQEGFKALFGFGGGL